MKRVFIITILIVGLMATYSFAHMQGGMMGSETMMGSQSQQQTGETPQTDWYHPCSHMMGSGMMGHHGMMGQSMTGHHGMMGRGYGKETVKPFTKDEVEIIVKNYLIFTRNPNLKLGNITEKEDYFEAEIITKEKSLVDKLLVDKYTGWFRSAY